MTTIRRIYAYVLALAGLSMVALASANLAQVLIDVLLGGPLATNAAAVRDTVALWGAAALVGLPAWLLHWLWIERTARRDARERASTLRRLYLYGILAGAALAVTGAASDVFVAAFGWLVGLPGQGRPVADAILRPLPFALSGALVAAGHWRIATADRVKVGEAGGSATLRRWYLYGVAFVGLLVLVDGARGVLETVWRGLAEPSQVGLIGIATPAAAALVGLGLWLVHWRLLPARLDPTSREADATAVLRSVYLFLALAVGVVGTLVGASQLLYYTVARLLGVDRPGGTGGDLLQAAAEPASAIVVFGCLWAYQRAALRQQAAAFSEAPRQAGVRRLYTSLVSLVALSVLGVGLAGLLWTLGDVLFVVASSGDTWRDQVALFATLALVGLPVWLRHWRAHPSAVGEAQSLARRLYLYVSLIVAALATLSSAAAGLYTLLGVALGKRFDTAVAVDLAHALAVAVVAASIGVYQWRVLRIDSGRGAAVPHPPATPIAAAAAAVAVVEIRAEDEASLQRALAALHASGVQVTLREPVATPVGGDDDV